MAGHSKWKNRAHRKGRQDASRGQLFTKLCRDIYAAVRRGGANPDTNYTLKTALDKARTASVPADTIQRTIGKAIGNVEGVVYEDFVYEGYGPGGIAVMLELSSNNRNRTAAEMRHLFSKYGGNLGESGSVAWMFERRGAIAVPRAGLPMAEDDFTLWAIDAGAEDVDVSDEEEIQLLTDPDRLSGLEDFLREAGIGYGSVDLVYLPTTTLAVSGEDEGRAGTLLELLEENDDVQRVFTNAEFADGDE